MTAGRGLSCNGEDPLGLEAGRFCSRSVAVADGVSLRVFDWSPAQGSRATIVFVAGMVTVIGSWLPVLRELAVTRRVVYIETREKASAEIRRNLMQTRTFTLPEMGRDVVEVCRALAVDQHRAVLVGSSLGANAILESLKQGLECDAAFLIGPNAEFFIPWWGHCLIRFPTWAYRALLPPVIWYLRHFRLDPRSEPEQAARYERALAEACPRRLKLTLQGLAGYHVLDGLGSVASRVGVAYSRSDVLHGEASIHRLVAALAGGVAIACVSNAAMHSPAVVDDLERFVKGAS